MKKILFVFALVLSGQLLDAQNEIVPKKKSQKAFAKLDFLSLDLPKDDPNMGFTGIHYNQC